MTAVGRFLPSADGAIVYLDPKGIERKPQSDRFLVFMEALNQFQAGVAISETTLQTLKHQALLAETQTAAITKMADQAIASKQSEINSQARTSEMLNARLEQAIGAIETVAKQSKPQAVQVVEYRGSDDFVEKLTCVLFLFLGICGTAFLVTCLSWTLNPRPYQPQLQGNSYAKPGI